MNHKKYPSGILAVVLVLPLYGMGANLQAAPLHDLFDRVLRDNVVNGRVNYPAIKRDSRFHDYLSLLRKIDPSSLAGRDEQLAFWINAYNALAIKGIIDGHTPVTLLGRFNYFKLVKYQVGGEDLTLDDLERKVIIPFDEPRIHFAIVCASSSCPKLRAEAYTPARLEEQLDENTREFINDESKNSFSVENRTAKLSKIFDWFKKDFEKHGGSVQGYIKEYLSDPEIQLQAANDGFRVSFMKYDWSLNGAPVN